MIVGYVVSIVLTAVLSGLLAWYAWRQRTVPGARAYARLALTECLLALLEILSVFSPSLDLALFWFRLRYTAIALIAVAWITFALEYSGRQNWLSGRFLIALFIVPLLTQALLWSNTLHGLWVRQEASLYRSGLLWIADTTARAPGLGYLAHTFYALGLVLAGIALILLTAWKLRHEERAQALWLASAGLVAFIFAANSFINLLPKTDFNVFTPGIGLSVLLIALAVLRFQFLKRAPEIAPAPDQARLQAAEQQRAMAFFLVIFLLLLAGLLTGGYLYYANYERAFRAQVDEQLAAIADLKVSGLQEWRAERLADAEMLRRNPVFAALVQTYLDNPADSRAADMLQTWLDNLCAAYGYERVFLLDTGGVERLASPPTHEPVAEHLIADSAAVLESGQAAFLDFHRDSPEGPIYLAVLVPVYAEGDTRRPLGVVVLRIDPRRTLYPYLQQWPAPSQTAETLLVRREGDTVLFLNELRFQPDAALTLRSPLTETEILAVKAALGQRGSVEGLDYQGHPVVGYLSAVPDSPWLLVTRMDKAEVYAPLQERMWETLAAVGLLTLVCGAGLLLVWRQQQLRYYRGQTAALAALRESQERLRESEETYRNLFQNAQVGLSRTRISDGKILEYNEQLARMFGYDSREAFIAEYVTSQNYVDPGTRERLIETLYRDGSVQNFEARLYRRDRSIMWARLSDRIYPDKGWIEGVVEDITARKEAEEALREALAQANASRRALLGVMEDQKAVEAALRESEERYRSLLELAPVGIAVYTEGKIVFANPACVRLLGAETEAQIIGKPLTEIIHPDNLQAAQTRLQNVLRGERGFSAEDVYLKLDGTPVNVEVIATPLLYKGQAAVQVIITDITERKRAEAQILAHQAELQRLLAEAEQSRRALLSVLEDTRSTEQALRQQAAQLALLNEIGAQIAAMLDLDILLEQAVHLVQEHFGYHHVAIFTLGQDKLLMRAIAGHFAHLFPPAHHLKLGQGMVGWAALHGETLVANDVDAEPRYVNLYPDQVPTRSELSVPIRLGGEVMGVIDLQSPQRNAFTQNDVMVIETLADQIAVAIGNARLYQAEQEQRRLAEALAHAAAAVVSSLHLDQVLDHILEEAAKVIPADAYNIMLIEDSKVRLVRWRGYEGRGIVEPQLDRLIDPNHYPSFTLMTREGQPVIIADTHNDPTWVLEEGQELWRSYAGAPLRVKGITVGFLNVNSTQVGRFGPADARRLQALADQAAIAIENAQLYHRLIRYAEDLEQRVAERTAQLEAQYEQLEAILQSTADGILVTDTQGEIIQINAVAFEWLNRRLAAQDVQHLRNVIRDLAQHAQEHPETTVELAGLDLQLKAAQVGGWQTTEPFVVISGHDVSEWKELDRMKSRFVSNVSHELRTPVTTIKLYVELMRRSPPEEWKEYLEVVEQEADRQARLVEDILQLSRIDAGRLELHPAAVSLNNLVAESVASHQVMARQKGLSLEQQLAEPAPLAWVDASQLMQVLNNLIENALHYTMAGGVTVSSGRQEREGQTWATVTVADTGIGISDEDLPRIFDRFYRGRMPRGISVPGTGLGLAIVKEIVEMHSGQVTVESQVGVGSTFTVWLPLTSE